MNPTEAYERYLVPAIFVPMGEDLISRAPVKAGQRVLDLACGTGVISRLLLPTGAEIVGADFSPGMLDVARGHTTEVEWVQADAAALPFQDASFDVCFCQQALQFFPDRGAALAEVRRVLRPGGHAALTVFTAIEDQPGYHALANALEAHVSAEAAATRRGIFVLHDRAELQSLCDDAGFGDVDIVDTTQTIRFPSVGAFMERQIASWRPEAVGPLEPAVADAVLRDMRRALADHETEDGFAFPMRWHVIVATC